MPKHSQRVSSHQSESTEVVYVPAHVTEVPCHSISGLGKSYNYMSSVTYYPIIGALLATLCVHDILPFIFRFMCQFVFMFHIIFMFHEQVYTYCISYIFFPISCLLHMEFHILVQYDTYVFTPHSCILIPL